VNSTLGLELTTTLIFIPLCLSKKYLTTGTEETEEVLLEPIFWAAAEDEEVLS
jgi:hypothetical protein